MIQVANKINLLFTKKAGANILKIIVLVLVTAMPGLHKLIPQLVFKIFNPSQLDGYTADNFIVLILSYFTCFSWGALFLSDAKRFDGFDWLIKFSVYCLLTVLLCIPLIFILHKFGFINDVTSTIILLTGWSLMQLVRHYLLARENRNLLLAVDLLFLIVYALVIFLFHQSGSSLINIYQGLCCFTVAFGVLIWLFHKSVLPIRLGSISVIADRQIFARVHTLSWINFSTGAVPLLFSPLAFKILPQGYAGSIGLITNLAAILLLLPRSISYFYYPKLSKAYFIAENEPKNRNFTEMYAQFEKNVWLSVVMLFGLSAVGVLSLSMMNMPFLQLKGIVIIGIMILCNTLFGQLLLPISHKLNITNNETILLRSNIITFILLVIFLFLSMMTIHNDLLLYFTLILIQLLLLPVRFLLINSRIKFKQLELA